MTHIFKGFIRYWVLDNLCRKICSLVYKYSRNSSITTTNFIDLSVNCLPITAENLLKRNSMTDFSILKN